MNQRSTKGASKQRRDDINHEINKIKDLLPLPDNIRVRLSQLQVMALCNSYINKSNCFNNINTYRNSDSIDNLNSFDFSQALSGFLLATTTEGKLLYVSENVTQYLGHSMVELMTQADTVYDVMDRSGQQVIKNFLMRSKVTCNEVKCDEVKVRSQAELNFVCHMNLGQMLRRQNAFERQKPMRVRGRLVQTDGRDVGVAEPIFVAHCAPVLSSHVTEEEPIIDTLIFETRHTLDMKFTDIQAVGEYHLGYNREEMIQQSHSWYHMIHQDHIEEFKQKHIQLVHSGLDSVQPIVLQVQTNQGQFIWLHVIMRLVSSDFALIGSDKSLLGIHCINHVIDEKEAFDMMNRERMDHVMSGKGLSRGSDVECTSDKSYEDRRRSDKSMSSSKLSTQASFNHEELMKRIRTKAQRKQMNKKARLMSDCGSSSGYSSECTVICDELTSSDQICSLSPDSLFDNTDDLRVSDDLSHANMSPFLDDNTRADNRSYNSLTPESSDAGISSYSSPLNNFSYLEDASFHQLDEPSFFEGVYPPVKTGKVLHSMKEHQGYPQLPELPELDQGLVEHFLDVECSMDFHQVNRHSYQDELANQKNTAGNNFADAFQNVKKNNLYNYHAQLEDGVQEDVHMSGHMVAQSLEMCEMSVEELIAGPLFLETIELLSANE